MRIARPVTLLITLLASLSAGPAAAEPPPGTAGTADATPAPARTGLNLDAWRGLTVRLYRTGPWADAAGLFTFPLENDGSTPVPDLSVDGQPVLLKDRRQVAPGRLLVHTFPVAPPRSAGIEIPAGGRQPLTLSFTGFGEAGTFETGVTLRSPGLPAPVRLPLTVEVTDRIYLPWLTILLGVLAAFTANYLSAKWRPREENRYRILSLRGEIERWQQDTQAPARQAVLAQFLQQLAKAEERNELDGSAEVKAQLDKIEEALDAFRKAAEEQRAAVSAALDAAQAQADALARRRGAMDRAQTATLDEVFDGLRDAEVLLRGRKLDAAEARLRELAQQQKSLEDALAPGSKGAPGPGGRLAFGMEEEARPAEGPPLRIEVLDPPEAWVRRASLSFEARAQDGSGILSGEQGAQQLIWDFDDGQQKTESAARPRVHHRFEQPGAYLVRVSARRGDEELAKAWRRITIAPGRSERAMAGLTQRLWLADLTLSLVALVVASMTGLWTLYFGKVFGSPEHYLAAFLWGFGIDSSVRGLSGVLGRIKGGL